MQHEDGHCDGCGAELVGLGQLTIDGAELCPECVREVAAMPATQAPAGAYDRG